MFSLCKGRFVTIAGFVLVFIYFFGNALSVSAAIYPQTTWISETANNHYLEVELTPDKDSTNEKGVYSFSFSAKRGSKNAYTGDIKLLLAAERNRCKEGSGQSKDLQIRYTTSFPSDEEKFCFTPWADDTYYTVNLTKANNYTQQITVTTNQVNNLTCGSFQTNIWVLAVNDTEKFTVANSSALPAIKRAKDYYFTYKGKTYPNAAFAGPMATLFTDKNINNCSITAAPVTPTTIVKTAVKKLVAAAATPTPSHKPTFIPTNTLQPSRKPSPSPSLIPTGVPSATRVPTKVPSPTITVIPTMTPKPTVTSTPIPSPTIALSSTPKPTKGVLKELPRAGGSTEIFVSLLGMISAGIFLRKTTS